MPENGTKKGETNQQTKDLKLFLKTENRPKKTGNDSNVNIAETPQYFLVFKKFPIILGKRRKRTQTHLFP